MSQNPLSGLLSWLRRILLDGLIVVLPIGLTGYLIWLGYNLIDSLFGRNTLLGSRLSLSLYRLFGIRWIPGLTIIYTVIVILLLGFFSRLYLGKLFQRYADILLQKTPLVKKIYQPAKQIVEAVLGQGQFSSFKEPVLIEYPRRNCFTIGFVTNRFEEKAAVYVFTAPDPFTGHLLLFPQQDLMELDIGVEDALKMVISLGISAPDSGVKNQKNQ